jgi:hypothetical protein
VSKPFKLSGFPDIDIYLNDCGGIVIKQKDDFGGEDQLVYFPFQVADLIANEIKRLAEGLEKEVEA